MDNKILCIVKSNVLISGAVLVSVIETDDRLHMHACLHCIFVTVYIPMHAQRTK